MDRLESAINRCRQRRVLAAAVIGGALVFAVISSARRSDAQERAISRGGAADGGADNVAATANGQAPFAGVADQPAPRTDAASLVGHERLLAKRTAGRIDVYFLGDSITRRWGTSDPEYADLLANWNANFYGWNAADFGWGGDTTQNILWRLEHGELDGVNPQVLVLLAGTNNLDVTKSAESQAEDVSRGVAAIVARCQEKAPQATLIVTAVFPRSDHAEHAATISQLNERLADLAHEPKVRFLNVNAALTDAAGALKPGMMHDGLHPTVAAYQIWADGLKPILTELLGSPAQEDHAPPPTASK